MTELYTSKASDFSRWGEKNDCTVLATSMALHVDYAKAHELCAAAGRKNGHGLQRYRLEKVLTHQGIKLSYVHPRTFIDRYPGVHKGLKNVTTHHTARFPDAWKDGRRYLIFTNSHVAYVENGKLHDWSGTRSFRVREIWLIED